ncbi:MAG: hypothetical protein K8I29_06100 [Alphaproteobacteria bacterium]|uniref:Uncharacterized protein n=1 Tax=Candidatus Nitrobium versatile TaxID=2884831 RepID=A0A953M0X4_9BACT|nr:hypothetical protein [Candidatus Nitrobium versatile]
MENAKKERGALKTMSIHAGKSLFIKEAGGDVFILLPTLHFSLPTFLYKGF